MTSVEETFDDSMFDALVRAAVPPERRDEIAEDRDLFDLGVESLRIIQLIMELEDALNFGWPADEMVDKEGFTVIGEFRAACREFEARSRARRADASRDR